MELETMKEDSVSDMREELSHVPLSELKAMQDKMGLKAPTEMSARRPVPRTTDIAKSKATRDPRFDNLSGEFNEKIFKQTYSFLSDIKTKEKLKLKKMIAKSTDRQKKSELKQLYNRMEQQELAEKRKAKQQELEREWKKKERERVKEGKKPYFLKNSEKKAMLETEDQKEREEKGKTQAYLKRKEKKLAAKEKKKKVWTTKSADL